MNLKSLLHRELGEGLTEKELASAVGVSAKTITNILADKLPQDPAIWEKFARYFRMDIDFLRTGESAQSRKVFELTGTTHQAPAGHIQKVPLLNWHQITEMVKKATGFAHVVPAEAMIETTDVSGTRTFAVKVRDDSMFPLFSDGEIIFVNPDVSCEPEHYVIVGSPDGRPESMLLRQLKDVGGQRILHPLNRRYKDLPLTKDQHIVGKVVRLRKNL
jgi:SOS-response transcriptional repressor LexA